MARPFVCGTLGAPSPSLASALARAFPVHLRRRLSTPTLTVWSSSPLRRRQAGGRVHYAWGEVLSPHRTSGRWWSVAEDELAAGIEVGAEDVVVHTDAFGLNAVYIRAVGSTTFFSNRLHQLALVVPGALHADEDAWNAMYAFGSPIGPATTFREIKRLDSATALVHASGSTSVIHRDPTWTTHDLNDAVSADDLVAAVSDALPSATLTKRVVVPLSGGWDSRILAIQAGSRARHPAPRLITTSGEGQAALDPVYAEPVAAALGLDQEWVSQAGAQWADHAARCWRATEHQTWMHPWLHPLAERLRTMGGTVVDGLAGDALIKGSPWITPEVLASRDPLQTLTERLVAVRLATTKLLSPSRHEAATASARSAIAASAHRVSGHPQAPLLLVCTTRMPRAVGRAAMDLVAAGNHIRTPFLDPRVLALSLQIPFGRRSGYELMRSVLAATAHPDIALLPSTNDPSASDASVDATTTSAPAAGPHLNAKAATWLVEKVLADESVHDMLSPTFLRGIKDQNERTRLMHYGRSATTLQWAALRADWNSLYAPRLSTL